MAEIKKNLGYGADTKAVAALAWPIMMSMASHTIIDITDTIMVGWMGTTELAAIGIATTILFLIMSFFMGLFEGVKVLAAQSMGANLAKKAYEYGLSGLVLVAPCAILVVGMGFFSADIFAFFGGPQEIQDLAVSYFNIRVFAPIFWFVTLALTHFFQGVGDTKTPMHISILVCLLNIGLDPIFIFGWGPLPAFGVAGSAIATVIATAIGSVWFLIIFFRRAPQGLKVNKTQVKEVISIGFPSGVRWFFDTAGYTMFTALVARLGRVELAANQICVKIVSLSILLNWGVAEATCILVGNHFGAKSFAKVRQVFFSGIRATVMLMSIVGILFMVFSTFIVGVFDPDAEVLALGVNLMLIVVLFQSIEALQTTGSLALYGTGDTKFPMFLAVTSSWLIMVPLAYYFGIVLNFGLAGMWWAAIIQMLVLTIAVLWRFLSKSFLQSESRADGKQIAVDGGYFGATRSEKSLSDSL